MAEAQSAQQGRAIDRSIAHLAVPALGSLVAEPLFLAVDAALIGHLGAVPLAGLAIASAILQTAVGLMVFLAYATTPLVARRRGAGDLRGAVQAGIDGLWLALGIGTAVGALLWLASSAIVDAFGATPDASAQARIFLGISCLGVPAMLIVFAASGLLRGLQDTRTPLAVAGIGFTVNALLNWWFVYGLGWGIAGSACGTVVAQWGMVAAYLAVISRHARRVGAGVLPHRDGVALAGRNGWWLFIRTAALRAALLLTVFAATGFGTATVAAYQLVFTVYMTAAFALDALAIAAQALVGDALGAGDAGRARLVVRRTVFWGIVSGAAIGAVIALASPVLGRIFTSDPAVLDLLPFALLAAGLTMPLGGYVFVLDGVLMGAGDVRYLAWTGLVNLALFAPVLWSVSALATAGVSALVWLTLSFTVAYMLLRATTLGLRAHSGRWVRLGV